MSVVTIVWSWTLTTYMQTAAEAAASALRSVAVPK